MIIAVAVEVPVLTVIGTNFVLSPTSLCDRCLISNAIEEVSGNRKSIHLECHITHCVTDAIIIGVEEELVDSIPSAVSSKFVKARGRGSSGGSKVTGEVSIRGLAEMIDKVAIDGIIVFALRIPCKVTIDIGID